MRLFFCQAEDGIRDIGVTGVQTCALPIYKTLFVVSSKSGGTIETLTHFKHFFAKTNENGAQFVAITDPGSPLEQLANERSEERRVGKECRSRWSPYH